MVKSGSDRASKYGVKYDAEVVRSRFAATSDLAKTAQITLQEQMAVKAAGVREILNDAGIVPIMTVPYQAFSNKLFAVCRKFGSVTAIGEATRAYNTWKVYTGIAANKPAPILQAIWDLYSDVLGAAPSP